MGVDARTIRNWRPRARSRRPEDARYVERERRLVAAEALAYKRPAVESWEAATARLELLAP